MNRQTLQAKESAPAKKKSSFSWLRPAAAHPAAEAEHEAPSASSPVFAHVPVRPMQLPGVPGFSCPFAPQRCPSGGACHTCPPKMQAKLKIGQPGDRYEQEADRVAEQVMRMPEPQVQRKCSAPGCKDEDEKKLLQTKPAGSAGNAQVDHPLIQSVLASPGQPLDAGTRSFMEPRFGQDFSGVRVHVGGQAAESARAVNARAYTVGRDVVFGEGQYAPGSDEGKRLVAHELVHVGQQKQSYYRIQKDDQSEAERIRKLNEDYENAVAAEDWKKAAELLNAFNREDIFLRLKNLRGWQLDSIQKGALDNPRVGTNSQLALIIKQLLTCNINNPELCLRFEDWMERFPTYKGDHILNLDKEYEVSRPDITSSMPEDLKEIIEINKNGWRPDCADISLFLKHYYLKKRKEKIWQYSSW
jgi:hypothetical protein